MESLIRRFSAKALAILFIVMFIFPITSGAVPYRTMFESIENQGSGDELAFLTFDSFADIISGNVSSQQFSAIDVNGTFNSTGIAYDDNSYRIMFESIENQGSGDELAFLTFDSFADIISGNVSSQQFSAIDVNGTFNSTGIAYDDNSYRIMFESIENQGSGDELAFLTFDSFADIISGNVSSQQFSAIDVNGTFNSTGIAYDDNSYRIMFESIENQGSGDELAFLTFDSFADIISGNVSSQQFSAIDVNGTFNSTGIVFEPAGQPVPEPATIILFVTGLGGLAGFGRKKFKK